MPRIFISHSTKDLEFIRTRLRPLFEELGMAVWCSAMDMRMAADWERQIRAALAETDWFVVVMSPDAQTSEWVQAETHWALEHKRGRVIPLMLRGCAPEEIHLKLGTLQYVDYRHDPVAASQLLRSLLTTTPGAISRLSDPNLVKCFGDTTVIGKRITATVLLFIEPALGPAYELRLSIEHSATIGRMEGVELMLADSCISRRHAKLGVGQSSAGPSLMLTDLDSSNGTYVNQERLLTSHPLAVGDLIELGNVRLLVRSIEYRS